MFETITLVLMGVVWGMGLAIVMMNSIWKREAVKRGHARYDEATGAWEWRDPR